MEKIKKKKKLLSLTNDYVFKRIFGHVGNEDITISLLSAIVGVRYKKIDLSKNTILTRKDIDDKEGILDVKIVADEEDDIDIEMQVAKQNDAVERIVWYWAKQFSESIKKGEDYSKTRKTICILIADFEMDKTNNMDKYHTKWQIREEEYKDVILTDKLEIHIIELKRLEKIINKSRSEKQLESWCKFILDPEKVEESGIMETDRMIKKAKNELEEISQSEKERRIAELREKAVRDAISLRNSGFSDGKKEGMKEGLKEGKKEGEKLKAIAIARKLLAKEMDKEEVSEITGLKISELNNL